MRVLGGRGGAAKPNKLIIGLQPEETIRLTLMAKMPGLDRQGCGCAKSRSTSASPMPSANTAGASPMSGCCST